MSRRIFPVPLAGVFIAVALLAALTYSASADFEPANLTLHVNTNIADAPDANPGNGKCETVNGNGICTLRAAIQETNAHAGADIIMIPVMNPIPLSRPGVDNNALNGDLDITGQLTINGSGTIVMGGGAALGERVLHIRPGAQVTINRLSVRHGAAPTLESGGGILNEGTLTLNTVYVSSNAAATGGGISNRGNLTVNAGAVHGNSARFGGGLENSGTASLSSLGIVNNDAQYGGGVRAPSGVLSLTNITLSGNTATIDGGGIFTESPAALSLFNVTITNNDANSDLNSSGDGGGISAKTGGISIRNTILSDNHRRSINGSAISECEGIIHSADYNLIRSSADCTIGGSTSHNLIGTSALLDELLPSQNYTHALVSNSPAIDTGNPAGCTDVFGSLLTTDQRGFIRPVDGNSNFTTDCDIGVLKNISPGAPPTSTPTATSTPTNTSVPATAAPTNTAFPPTATPTQTSIANACPGKPAAPALIAPSNNALTSKKKAKLDWSDANCADKYRVMVRQDSKGGPRADKKSTTASKYKTKKLAKGHTYYWRVKACNLNGCTKSPWSTYSILP